MCPVTRTNFSSDSVGNQSLNSAELSSDCESRVTYALPKTRTNYGLFNIRYQGAKMWNDISDDINLIRKRSSQPLLQAISAY